MTISDDAAVDAMRTFAEGTERDVPVVAGESGAAGLAGLIQASGSAEDRAALGLDERSNVLLLNTEGATAPALYEQLTGLRADAVLKAQRRWQPV